MLTVGDSYFLRADENVRRSRRQDGAATDATPWGTRKSGGMSLYPADPLALAVLVGAVVYLMVFAGMGKKQLTFRVKTCPVCHHPRTQCTCRWL